MFLPTISHEKKRSLKTDPSERALIGLLWGRPLEPEDLVSLGVAVVVIKLAAIKLNGFGILSSTTSYRTSLTLTKQRASFYNHSNS